jgi:ribosome maturation factor RimP
MSSSTSSTIVAGVDLNRVRAALEPVLSAHGVDLVELEFTTDRQGWTLRLTIERPSASDDASPTAPGGVTLEDCAEVSRDASSVLDVEDLIPHRYHLEVSSPGLDRPLKSPADFARFAGKTARVKLSRPAPDGQALLRGVLERAIDGTVAVTVDGKRIEVPLADVAEANLVFELSPQPKKGGPKHGPKTANKSGKKHGTPKR